MKCELCGKELGRHDLVVPVVRKTVIAGVDTMSRGIHLDCIKEMLDVLRSATLAMAPSTETEALTGETNGT